MKSQLEVTAGGLQLDSFCGDSMYPVILRSSPPSDPQRPDALHPSPAAALAITLQVHPSWPPLLLISHFMPLLHVKLSVDVAK